MLRTRKNAVPSGASAGAGGIATNGNGSTNATNGTLPTFYSNGSSDSLGSATSNGNSSKNGFSLLPSILGGGGNRRRRHKSAASGLFRSTNNISHRRSSICCNKYMFGLVSCCLLVLVLLHGKDEDGNSRINIRTFAAPPIMTWDRDPSSSSSMFHRRASAASAVVGTPHPPHPNGSYDVAVLGAGPAGLSAALFAARAGLSVLVLGSDSGSLSETTQLDNFPAFMLQSGPEWLVEAKQQAAQWGASFAQAGLLVDSLHIMEQQQVEEEKTHTSPTFVMNLGGSKHMTTTSRAVIVATGATGRRLNIPLESMLWGKSVHSCAVCDGSSYVGKTVVVVGGGDAAVDGALLLARYAKHVILVHRRPEFRASNQRNLELLRNAKNIEIRTPFTIKQFETKLEKVHILTGVQIQHTETQEMEKVPCDGVFELIGATPNTAWLKKSGAEMNEEGFLKLSPSTWDASRATTLEGVFAAGEVTDSIYRQAITAAAEGAQAAMDAERWLRAHPTDSHGSSKARNKSDNIPLQKVLVSGYAEVAKPGEQQKLEDLNGDIDCNYWEQDCVNKLVKKYPVVLFSKDRCPECQKAMELFTIEGLPEGHRNLFIVDITSAGTTKSKQARELLLSMTGRKSVPNIFVDGKSIGGHDELSEFHRDGRLKSMLAEAGAIDLEECDLEERDCIEIIVNRHPVVVFSKPWCPYCKKALEALAIEGLPEGHINLHVIDLSALGKRAKAIQKTLSEMTGRRTVPNVFIGGTSIGGGDETVKFAREGKLQAMLVEARAFGDETPEEVEMEREEEEMAESEAAAKQRDLANEPEGDKRCDLAQEPCLTKVLGSHPVVIFTKQGCPHCTKALEALALEGLSDGNTNLHIINLSSMERMPEIQDTLERMTGRRTVPNVFIGGNTIGGGSETVQLQQSGELRTMLEQVHAIEAPKPQAQVDNHQQQQQRAQEQPPSQENQELQKPNDPPQEKQQQHNDPHPENQQQQDQVQQNMAQEQRRETEQQPAGAKQDEQPQQDANEEI